MARIKIAVPANFNFSMNIPIRITDLNYGGHVGNDTVLSLIHEARAQFLQRYGYEEMEIAGFGLIMVDAGIEYKAELFHGDIVTAHVCAQNFTRMGLDFFYKLEKDNNGKQQVVALAKTGMVCFDYKAKKMAPLPAEVVTRLSV